MSRIQFPNLIILLLSFVSSISAEPPVSSPVSFNVDREDVICMQDVKNPINHIAFRYSGWVPDPPPLIHVVGEAISSKVGRRDHKEPIQYILKHVNTRCPSSLVYSDANLKFDNITLRFNVYTGYQSLHKFTSFDLNVHSNIRSGWINMNDTYGKLEMYCLFQSERPTLVPPPAPATASQAAAAVSQNQFSSEYVCVATIDYVMGIKVDFGGRTKQIPKYNAVNIYVFNGETPVRVKTVDAWPCENGYELHAYRRPIIVVDSGLNNLKILWTFNEIGSDGAETTVPLKVLQEGNYFETDCAVRYLSERTNWVSWEPHIYLVETELHIVKNQWNQRFPRVRSVNGHIPLKLFRSYEQNSRYMGLSYKTLHSITWYGECEPITEEIPLVSL